MVNPDAHFRIYSSFQVIPNFPIQPSAPAKLALRKAWYQVGEH